MCGDFAFAKAKLINNKFALIVDKVIQFASLVLLVKPFSKGVNKSVEQS